MPLLFHRIYPTRVRIIMFSFHHHALFSCLLNLLNSQIAVSLFSSLFLNTTYHIFFIQLLLLQFQRRFCYPLYLKFTFVILSSNQCLLDIEFCLNIYFIFVWVSCEYHVVIHTSIHPHQYNGIVIYYHIIKQYFFAPLFILIFSNSQQ